MRSVRLYNKLLKLYPSAYRQKYADQMSQTYIDMLDDAQNSAQKAAIMLRAFAELPFTVMRQQSVTIGASMTYKPTDTAMQNTIAGTVLLIPFVLYIFVHSLQANKALSLVSLLVLPAVAFLLAISTYITEFLRARRVQYTRISVQFGWPMLVLACVSAFLLVFVVFHDSTHCIMGNPVRILHNPHDSLQCIQRGMLGGS